ncbi:GNAT family N-acetyltransferase [Planomicrobium sp. CPCC 101110]|uniref:GNAT family N-acetyltransferase n=1 Tax=Planomicrobium sp. CPCC 101110 TaxID=2599619 RepID=UPI0011B5FF99|nr:GNAT family N-acetyltransferase [Planomicrobium sp. CPCC 101110]TWT27172.1 GNAT family N-acetyltransferase [Planomicrobium sp. CPCC 101110]
MLVRYKKSCEKIAMGLLSLMPQQKNIKALQQTMVRYGEEPGWQLYLLKAGESYVGLIGIEVHGTYFTVHDISVLPSFRGEGFGHIMAEKIQKLMQQREMQTTEATKSFLEKCKKELAAS